MWCTIRPERLTLCERGRGTQKNRLDGTLIQHLFFGDRTRYRVRLSNQTILNVQMAHKEEAAWQAGDPVSVAFSERDVHVFNL